MKIPLITEQDTLSSVVLAEVYAVQSLIKNQSPFVDIPWFLSLKVSMVRSILRALEFMLGSRLYIKNELGELFFIDARIRTLLLKMAQTRIMRSWYKSPLMSDAPHLIHYKVALEPITLPSGEQVTLGGSQGSGVGETSSTALIPAIAEALERHSCATWKPSDILAGSFTELEQRGAVSLSNFSFFSASQLKDSYFANRLPSDNKRIGWVRARALTTDKIHLIPAQLVYLFYYRFERDPFLFQVTTNGVAAHTSFERAAYRAICEAIERDAVMIFWLNKLVPNQIDLQSINIPKVQKQIEDIELNGFEVSLLDMTTDLGVPVLAAVLRDTVTGKRVSLTSACGFDVAGTLQSVLHETLRFTHTRNQSTYSVFVDENTDYTDIKTMSERAVLWTWPEMQGYASFILSGKKIHYEELEKRSVIASEKMHLLRLKEIFQQKQYECYLKEITSDFARKEGLYVVRAVAPDLVPIYFNENERPYGQDRLYTVPQLLGYRSSVTAEQDLNKIPHPFI